MAPSPSARRPGPFIRSGRSRSFRRCPRQPNAPSGWQDGELAALDQRLLHLNLGILAKTLFGADIESEATSHRRLGHLRPRCVRRTHPTRRRDAGCDPGALHARDAARNGPDQEARRQNRPRAAAPAARTKATSFRCSCSRATNRTGAARIASCATSSDDVQRRCPSDDDRARLGALPALPKIRTRQTHCTWSSTGSWAAALPRSRTSRASPI